MNDNLSRTPVSMTIVACIESGILEPFTIRMVDSLRRFGGRFANLDVVAVTPRVSAPLARETRRRMFELGIRHLTLRPGNPYAWQHYTNKPEAISAVEREVASDAIAWVDSDILFLREPEGLELAGDIDFSADATDIGVIGSTGAGDPNDVFWQMAAAQVGWRADELPWLNTADGHRIRFYWNSGLFVYRRSAKLGQEFLSDLKLFLDRRVGRNHTQVHFMDQVVLGLTVLRLGLKWRALPPGTNFPVSSFVPANYDAAKVANVRVLHFHDSMNPGLWAKLLATIATYHPEVHAWLEELGPVTAPGSRLARIERDALRMIRGLKRRIYYMESGFRWNEV